LDIVVGKLRKYIAVYVLFILLPTLGTMGFPEDAICTGQGFATKLKGAGLYRL
jgi:hypothetical protein